MIDTSKKYLHFTFGEKWGIRVVQYVKTKKGFYRKTLKSIQCRVKHAETNMTQRVGE